MKQIFILIWPMIALSACCGNDPKLHLEHPHQVLLELAPGRIKAQNLYSTTPLQAELNIGPVESPNKQDLQDKKSDML